MPRDPGAILMPVAVVCSADGRAATRDLADAVCLREEELSLVCLADQTALRQTLRRAAFTAAVGMADRVGSLVPTAPTPTPPEELRQWLASHQAPLLASLDRLSGMREILVECHLDAPAPRPPDQGSTGRSYLRAIAAEQTALETARSRLGETLSRAISAAGERIRAVKAQLPPPGSDTLKQQTSLLVAATDADWVLAALTRPMRRIGTTRLLGPWPPYSFSRLERA